MKKQLDLFILTFLGSLFYSCGRITAAFKSREGWDIITIAALMMLIIFLYQVN